MSIIKLVLTPKWEGGGGQTVFLFSFSPCGSAPVSNISLFGEINHLSKIKDEAVALVEAAPAQLHLLGTDVAFPFDLVQPVHRSGPLSPPKARLHSAILQWERGAQQKGGSNRDLLFHLTAGQSNQPLDYTNVNFVTADKMEFSYKRFKINSAALSRRL